MVHQVTTPMTNIQPHPDTPTLLLIPHHELNILQAEYKIIRVVHTEVAIQEVHIVVALPILVVHTVAVVPA